MVLDVCDDIGSRTERIQVEDLVSGVGNDSDALDVVNDISSRIETVKSW